MSELGKYYNLIISNHFLKSASLVLLSIVLRNLLMLFLQLFLKKWLIKPAQSLMIKFSPTPQTNFIQFFYRL